MQDRPLLLSGLLTHAATYHPEVESVSRAVEGPIQRATNAELERRCRQLASALAARGLPCLSSLLYVR